jgi:hypothetical protein
MIHMAIKLSILTLVGLSIVLGTLILSTPSETGKVEIQAQELTTIELTPEEKKLMGSWVEKTPDDEKIYQGFTLHSDGSASSINTDILLYKKWKVQGDTITLLVESRGLGVESQDIETYAFEHVSKNRLLLKIGNSVFTYKRIS